MKFEFENIKMYNMDCMEFMKDVSDGFYELAIVDPPYGINIVDEFQKTIKSSTSMFNLSNGIIGDGQWDKAVPSKDYFGELLRVSRNQIIWGGNYFLDYLHSTRCMLIWDKMNGTNPMADAELAWTSFDKSVRMFKMHHFSSGYGYKIHPTQKPVKLYEWLLTNYAKQGDKILDTHGGSFSSAIACHKLGFDFTGIELDKEYFDNAVRRFQEYSSQLKLF
jgi:site-specific DNA-methyltransferase (adenine-specific)